MVKELCCTLLLIYEGRHAFYQSKISVSKVTSMTRGNKVNRTAAPAPAPAAADKTKAAAVVIPRARTQSGSVSPRADGSILKTTACNSYVGNPTVVVAQPGAAVAAAVAGIGMHEGLNEILDSLGKHLSTNAFYGLIRQDNRRQTLKKENFVEKRQPTL